MPWNAHRGCYNTSTTNEALYQLLAKFLICETLFSKTGATNQLESMSSIELVSLEYPLKTMTKKKLKMTKI